MRFRWARQTADGEWEYEVEFKDRTKEWLKPNDQYFEADEDNQKKLTKFVNWGKKVPHTVCVL